MKFLTPFLLIAATSAEAFSFGRSTSSSGSLRARTIQLNADLAFPLVLTDGTLRVYYQASDTSIHSFQPFGLPGVSGTQDIQLLAAGVARANTPLAAVNILNNNSPSVALYYFAGSSGNILNEAVGYTNGTSWGVTALSNYNFTTTSGNQFLYAFPWPAGGSNARRVGFPFLNGTLGEAICVSTKCWYNAIF